MARNALEQAELRHGGPLVDELCHRGIDARAGEVVDLEPLHDLPPTVDGANRQGRHDALGDAVDTGEGRATDVQSSGSVPSTQSRT